MDRSKPGQVAARWEFLCALYRLIFGHALLTKPRGFLARPLLGSSSNDGIICPDYRPAEKRIAPYDIYERLLGTPLNMYRATHPLLLALSLLVAATFSSQSLAQLQITEILYDSRSEEPDWEWFELRNTGASEVDLDGYVFDDRSTDPGHTAPNIVALVGDATVNTIIPAGQTAVIYNGAALDFDESRFRSAWNVGSTVPLIGVNGWESLNNGDDAFGLWEDLEAYQSDLEDIDEDDDVEVGSFTNAVAWVDYGSEGFPGSSAGNSLAWNGNGDFQAGENWLVSEPTTAQTSVATTLEGLAINDTRDIGNPGTVIAATEGFNSLAFTEIMYDPGSDEPAWEWIELYNGTDATIDFSSTPYFLDDKAGGDRQEANLNTGSIGPKDTAILFSSSTAVEDMTAAWGEQNFIPVADWPSLNNGGDLIAIWSDANEYAADGEVDGDRLVDGAVFSVEYLDGNDDWPATGQGPSISIVDLADDANLGTNWVLSADGDGDSVFATGVIASQSDHDGGDVGTPGTFGQVVVQGLDLDGSGTVDADDAALLCSVVEDGSVADFLAMNGSIVGDFDFNGTVEFADFLNLSGNFGQTESVHYGQGDADCQNGVDFADFLALSANFGKSGGEAVSVPEPTSLSATIAFFVIFGFRFRVARDR